MLNFCTLFNSNYLSRGLVMYDSLKLHCNHFHLYVFAFDDTCYHFLRSQNYQDMTVISLKEFEDEDLLSVKTDRSAAEYCWTCTPSAIFYCIKTFGLPACTYIDADLLFYSDPGVLLDEMGNASVLITEHRYSPERNLTHGSGKYCVQFVTFKNDERGMDVLKWWRDACIAWCYARLENGKFGDQKYLDDWTTRFEGIHELQHLGGGIAPWNVQQYSFSPVNNKINGTEIRTGKKFAAVFFHFHGVKFYEGGMVALTDSGYALTKNVKKIFYKPYIQLLNKKTDLIYKIDNSFNPNGSSGRSPAGPLNLWILMKFYWYDLKMSPKNIFAPNLKKRIANHHFHRSRSF
jgi:hypothetical protein